MIANNFRVIGILLILHYANAYVLLTANIEDVKRVVRKLFPDAGPDKVLQYIAKASQSLVSLDTDNDADQIKNHEQHDNSQSLYRQNPKRYKKIKKYKGRDTKRPKEDYRHKSNEDNSWTEPKSDLRKESADYVSREINENENVRPPKDRGNHKTPYYANKRKAKYPNAVFKSDTKYRKRKHQRRQKSKRSKKQNKPRFRHTGLRPRSFNQRIKLPSNDENTNQPEEINTTNNTNMTTVPESTVESSTTEKQRTDFDQYDVVTGAVAAKWLEKNERKQKTEE